MKIYKLNTQDDGVTCIYSDKNKFSCLGFQRHYGSYMDAGERFQDWDILHFYMNSSINKKKKVYNIMHHNLLFVIVDEQSKIAIQEKYSNCIQFLEAVNDDDPLTKYYLLYPFKSIEG